MIKTKEEIIEKINSLLPEGSEDLSILEDVSDTFDNLSRPADHYETKYNDLLKKYRERFTDVSKEEIVVKEEIDDEDDTPTSFDDLFETKYKEI